MSESWAGPGNDATKRVDRSYLHCRYIFIVVRICKALIEGHMRTTKCMSITIQWQKCAEHAGSLVIDDFVPGHTYTHAVILHLYCSKGVASFPGPTQLFVACSIHIPSPPPPPPPPPPPLVMTLQRGWTVVTFAVGTYL